MVAEKPETSEKKLVGSAAGEHPQSTIQNLASEAYDFASAAGKGFIHDAAKPMAGINQIIAGQKGSEIDPPVDEQKKSGYVVGAMAGQAFDFLVSQVVAKKLGLGVKAATILTSGTLAALGPTQAGGLDLKERSENFATGAASMTAYTGLSHRLSAAGLKGTLAKDVFREATSGAFAGALYAQSNSYLKTGHLADATTTGESMLGWAVSGAAFNAAGRGLKIGSDQLMPEVLNRMGKLEPTAVTAEGTTGSREFIITSGKEALEDFKKTRDRGLTVQVRELLADENGKVNLGARKNMLVQHLAARESDGRLLPSAKTADLLATCNPENLSAEHQAKHVFGEAKGNVWLYTGKNNRLLLTAGTMPVEVTNVNGYKQPFKLNRGETTVTVMSDLLVGDPSDPDSEKSKNARTDFRRMVDKVKKLRIDGVSMDVWHGVAEKEQGKYDFTYYEKLFDEVIAAGLDVTGVLSFHRCGGNVGDTETVNLPSWIWRAVAKAFGSTDENIGKYKSEQGHFSEEYIQPWADKAALPIYSGFMKAFKENFAAKAPFIAEVNVSLGPSGEMRHPSYNSHDFNVGYPTRGAMQASSDLAQQDLRRWSLAKYGDITKVGQAWTIPDLTVDNIRPPSDPKYFYDNYDHVNTQYGRDFMDWYNESLVNHGKLVLGEAQKVFGAPDSPFHGTPIGAKVPGVHWRMGWIVNNEVHYGDRSAEANAGLIQTSLPWTQENAYGYQSILNMFKSLQPAAPQLGSPVIPSYTCLELDDGQDGPDAQSLPHTAAIRFGAEAAAMGLQVHGENALPVYNPAHWTTMTAQLRTPLHRFSPFTGLTLLRMHDVVDSEVGRTGVTKMLDEIHSADNLPTPPLVTPVEPVTPPDQLPQMPPFNVLNPVLPAPHL